jgi:hypothetical protein
MTRRSRRSNKRKKGDSSKSGDTPPDTINMPAPMSQQQQQALSQAHDSIYKYQQCFSGSQVMSEQLVFPHPAQASLPTPEVQSNAPHVHIRHSTPVPENIYQ